MAKELPFFKFEPNQWENGNIQICSREDKGLFIDLCSMYWSRLGDVPLKLAIQKLCAGNATAFDSLIEEHIFEVVEGNIFINFLSEQLNEFEDVSKQNSKNAKDGWEKRRTAKAESDRNATASIPQCENYAIREDKIKEDKIIKEPTVIKFSFFNAMINYGFDKKLVNDWLLVRKNKRATNTETAFNNFINEIEKRSCNYNEMLSIAVANSWSGFKHEWIDNLTTQNKNGKKQQLAEFTTAIRASNPKA